MAASIVHAGDYLLVISGHSIAHYSTTDGINEVIDVSDGDETQPRVTESTDKTEDKPDKEHLTRKDKDAGEGTYRILAFKLSHSKKYLAVSTDNKQLLLYKLDARCQLISRRCVIRRVSCMSFDRAEEFVLCADKSGDVYRYPVREPEKTGDLLLGHLSMVLDVVISPNDEFILTCDRDEKIRISRYPNCYNIHAFCLGHTEFVTAMCLLDGFNDLMVSGSGDATIRLWNYRDGRPLSCIDCKRHTVTNVNDNLAVQCLRYHSPSRLLAVSFKKQKSVLLFVVEEKDRSTHLSLEQHLSTTGDVWDLNFDADGNLFVLQNIENETVLIFTKNESGKYDESKSNSYTAMMDRINSDWKFFADSLQHDDDPGYSSLYKVKFDNMKEYLEKKHKRINAGKASSAETEEEGKVLASSAEINNEPPLKKNKIVSS
ncbi:tRNA (guanine-N(7)-)-methyltransferase non-catalytic subunit wdr4-like [Tubulanus polymorphus]|uniref:tRNA (guanine-N(7)-)-methyltransferase non-catalytic subunit wdr4-like n=1 Tax=Tubulanus polymorphus TaxID=672921 RepID=UPI003DA535E7